MNFESFLPYYTFEVPAKMRARFDTFTEEKACLPMVSEEEFRAVEQATKVDPDCFRVLRELNAKLCENKTNNAAARFLRHGLFEACPPWDNGVWQQQLLTVEGFPQETVDLLIVTAALGYTLTVRKPPADLNEENVGAYRGYIKAFTDHHDYWGIDNPTWNRLCAGGCMFLFHTLKFQPEQFSNDFLVLTDGEHYVTLLKGNFCVSDEQILVEPELPHAVESVYEEREDGWYAHEIAATGRVSLTPALFPKEFWKVALCEKDAVLGFHIPSKVPYTPEDHKESMRQALEFYRAYFPDMEFKAFVCYSWLYSLQNADLLPAGSRILEMQKCGHLCPMLARFPADTIFVRKGSELHKRAIDYYASGKIWRTGFMYSPLSEAEHFGEWRHE